MFLDRNSQKDSRVNNQSNYPDKENRKELIHNFIDNLLGRKNKQIISLKEQVDLMTVCFAADESLKKNKEINIDYL